MATWISETFGATGTATTAFGGQWWIVGIVLLLFFVTFLMAYRVRAEGIATLLVLGLTSVGVYQLFVINEQITQTILLVIFMFVGFMAYIFFGR